MITFILSIVALLLGYFLYSRFVEKIFGADPSRKTPAYTLEDGVDYVPMNWWKIFLIQFLNIAGLGPIFGAIAGAMWGPVAFLWIVLGSVFAGAVHDYLSGMISIRLNGLSIPEIVGKYLGIEIKQFMRVFTVGLMVLVGAVFITGPSNILHGITPGIAAKWWAIIVFIYYILATLLPIDKLIGRIYPVFGFALLFMAVGITFSLFYNGYQVPELTFSTFGNLHNQGDKMPIFPMLFVTVACGAISGFHATQSPLMARCMKNEKLGRRVFYGAMITEGVVALIWAAAGMAFFGGVKELNTVMVEHKGDAAWAVNLISNTLLGKLGGILAILGVVAAPITSGDTAFRSARLIVADFLNIKQIKLVSRLYISIPLFVVGFLLTQVDFSIIWRYMAWSNQVLATIVLWTVTVYLYSEKKLYWIALIPAVFMTMVVSSYIMVAPEGFTLSQNAGVLTGSGITFVILLFFFVYIRKQKKLSNLNH
jgi:carbon starvation protein CstA